MSGSLLEELSEEELLEEIVAEVKYDLKPCKPEQGVERFLDKKRPDITPNTIGQYQTKLDKFLDFCARHDIEDLRELDGRIVDDYTAWLREESSDEVEELDSNTMSDEMYLLRDCISYFEEIEAVKPGLSESVSIPDSDDGRSRDVDLDPGRVDQILDHLEKFEYATLEHVVFLLLARTGRRTGGIHSLDCEHAHLDDDAPYLEFRHLPPETRLKNEEKSEGHIAISEADAKVIADFIETNRPDVSDQDSREPLLATQHGRVSKSTIRRIIYSLTRPCSTGGECPHGRDPDDCEAAQTRNGASQCPSSRSPHTLKHGYISECRREGVPIDVLTDRCDVSEEVLREHYDETTQEERCQLRREILDSYSSGEGGGYL